jgi:exodeoxyribonuclease VII large subunit
MTKNIYTITKLNNLIRDVLKDNITGILSVTGEISNIKTSRGHMYLTLKDKESTISANIWNYQKYNLNLNEGDKVDVQGNLNLYSKGGTYSLSISSITISGVGDIYKDYIEYKKKFEQLGYFDKSNKKELNTNISKIGVITAMEGAALKDFLYVLEEGGFRGKVYIKNSIVQGKDCATSVATCIDELDIMNLDILVVTRGGGSFEDLMGFSHPTIIKAIYKANTCVISAIGHEVDTMLSDYVADIRAPTPSIAGELIVKNQSPIYTYDFYDDILTTCYNHINYKLDKYQNKLDTIENKVIDPNSIAIGYLSKLDDGLENIKNIVQNRINYLHNRCDALDIDIDRTNPTKILEQGYCMLVLNNDNDNSSQNIVIKSKKEYMKYKNKNKKFKIVFMDGSIII